ncbi:DUF5983 family protein [Mangrovibrevibacter kandeliae]|uniref:DUF5983 family protein n=1 Tax=Mangrovibrevibacter kandeliae TaxID=2968473 RepID=UPI0021177471|nr:hypothetical protein [Aurantimonas sp. CSK15Z-1]MCQ8782911.1 hypothetical protein [Aurantimonas sp. CSK15Z-1]
MNILPFLDIAAAHLTDGDVELLDSGKDLPIDTMAYEYGWIVSTARLMDEETRDEVVTELRTAGFSEAFIAAAIAAGSNACWLLRFDVDADIEESLPVGGGQQL